MRRAAFYLLATWETAAQVVPNGWGEREGRPRSTRWPVAIMSRVDRIAKETEQSYTTTLFHLIRHALDEYARQRATRSPIDRK